jgi:hypothetical protein
VVIGRRLASLCQFDTTTGRNIMRAFCLAALAALIVGTLSTSAEAQARRQSGQAAVTDTAAAGADYDLQGEYAAWSFSPSEGNPFAGLQVIALGNGKFEAVAYRSGLPGNGWDRANKKKLTGQADSGQLLLSGGEDRVLVNGKLAIVVDAAGREMSRLIKVQRTSPTMGLAPPAHAVVLFDGSSTDQFLPQPKPEISPDGLLIAGVRTKMLVDAFRMHLEFRTPFMPASTGQQRGNSGVYIQRRYELQILDSFGLDGVFNEAGSLYRQTPPDVNMALPPLTWQTYDIWFTPPRFGADGKTKTANARITVLHNGIPIHWHREITAKTGGGQQEGTAPLPIELQDHGNPVMFRNIWIIPGEGDQHWDTSDSVSVSDCYPRGRLRWLHRRR